MTDYTHYKMLIDGQWVPASDGAKFNSLNPTTGKVWATVPEAAAEDVDRAVRAADRAFNQGPWPAMSAYERTLPASAGFAVSGTLRRAWHD